MTMYKKATEQLQQLQAQLENVDVPDSSKATIACELRIAALAEEAAVLGASIAKMVAKAAESDPDKQVYGKAMRSKVAQLADGYKVLNQKLDSKCANIAPLAEAARSEVAAAAEMAERKRIIELKKIEEEESMRVVKARAKQQADEAAEAKIAATEKQRVAEETRLREEERQAAVEAAAQAQKQRAKEVSERSRLNTLRLQEEGKSKQAADLAAEQSAKAAAATRVAAKPLLNPECELLHLSRGRIELDGLLCQAGDRQLVVVDYSTGWCGPCRMMEPVLVAWARQLGPRVVFVKVDAEAQGNSELARLAGIRGYPTFHIYSRGTVVGDVVGGDRAALWAKIDAEAKTLAPLPGSGPASAVALANAMSAMKRAVAPDVFMTAAKMLLRTTTNIVDNPGDPKFRRIKVNNNRYNSAIGCKPHGKQCMEALGFRSIFEAAEEVLLLDNPSPELPRVKVMLELAMGGRPGSTVPATATLTTAASMTTESASGTPATAATLGAAAATAVPSIDGHASANAGVSAGEGASASRQAGAVMAAGAPDGAASTSTPEPASAPSTASHTQQDDDNLTEDEQLERAIQLSLDDSKRQTE